MSCKTCHLGLPDLMKLQVIFISWLTVIFFSLPFPLLAQTSSPLTDEAKRLEQQGNEYYNALNYAAAIPLLEKSIALSLKANTPLTAAYTRHILAFAQLAAGNKVSALEHFETNLQYHRTRNDKDSVGHYLFYAAQIYFDLNNYEKALAYLNESRTLAGGNKERMGELDQWRVKVLYNLGDRSAAEKIVSDTRSDYSKEIWQKYLGEPAVELGIPYNETSSSQLLSASTLLISLVILLLLYAGYRVASLRKRLPEISLVIVALVISFSLAEVGLRFWSDGKTAADVRHFLHTPNRVTNFFPKPDVMPGVDYAKSSFTTNDAGLRGDLLPSPNTYRILTIGGSSTEVLYLDDKDAWPYRLQQELGSRLQRAIWVGNAGKSGLNSFSHLTQMYFALQEMKPDMVIVTAGINDLNQCISGGLNAVIDNAERVKKPNFVFDYAQHVFDRTLPLQHQEPPLRLVSLFNQLVTPEKKNSSPTDAVEQDEAGLFYVEQRRMRQQAEKTSQAPNIAACVTAFQENLKKIVRLGKTNNVPVIFVTQGALYRPDLTTAEENLLWFGSVGSNPFGKSATQYYSAATMDQLLNAYNSTTLSVCRAENIPCWDADNELPQTTETYYDDVHFNIAGSRNMATKLAAFLKPILQ